MCAQHVACLKIVKGRGSWGERMPAYFPHVDRISRTICLEQLVLPVIHNQCARNCLDVARSENWDKSRRTPLKTILMPLLLPDIISRSLIHLKNRKGNLTSIFIISSLKFKRNFLAVPYYPFVAQEKLKFKWQFSLEFNICSQTFSV